jgi:hypothetical protein
VGSAAVRVDRVAHAANTCTEGIGEQVGQRNLAVNANTYTHVLTDESELDYQALLART